MGFKVYSNKLSFKTPNTDMKTSATQFEMLVNFMQQHGDINKPSKHAQGRINTLRLWEQLTTLLNADSTGESKSTEKWKKVWSDFKNNTKKKAAKINRAARGTGGGPALPLKLTDLEERVLNILGPQAATGLEGVVEAGLLQEPADTNRTLTLSPTPQYVIETESPSIFDIPVYNENINITVCENDAWDQPGPSHQPHVPPSAHLLTVQSSPNRAPCSPMPQLENYVGPPSPSPPPCPATPARRGRTPRRVRTPRRRRGGANTSPRRRATRPQSHIDRAAQHFLDSDIEWRNFQQQKHRDEMEMKEREQQIQARWQDISMQVITAINKLIEKF